MHRNQNTKTYISNDKKKKVYNSVQKNSYVDI